MKLSFGAVLLKRFKKAPLKKRTASKKELPRVVPKKLTALKTPPEQTPLARPPINLIRPNDELKKSIEQFLADQRSIHTKRAYEKDLKRFVKFLLLKNERLREQNLDRGTIIAFKDFLLSENLKHTTIDRHLATLRSFFRWLCEDGFLQKNPAENVRFLNPKRESSTEGFTNEEVLKILARPNLHTRSGSMHYAILMMLFYCGLRRSELCDLMAPQLCFERGHHFIRLIGKGNKERVIVLRPEVVSALNHYFQMNNRPLIREKHPSTPLFMPVKNNRNGRMFKPLDSSLIFYVVRKYAKLAGITKRVSPHSCRATAISNARDHQVPDRAIQEFAGWSTTTMITRYDKRKTSLEQSATHAIQYTIK